MRTLEQNVALAFSIFAEEMQFVMEDLRSMKGPILVEGCVALPEVLATLGIAPRRAFYMVPTESFQREHYARRIWARDRVAGASDPDQALENWMARDVEFARRVASRAEEAGYPVLWVDGSRSVEDVVRTVSGHFGL